MFNLRPVPVPRAHLLHEVVDGRGAAVHVHDIGQAAPGPDTAFACGEGQGCRQGTHPQLATPPAFGNPSPRESYETENRSDPAHPQQLRFGAKNQLTAITSEATQIRLGARAQERGFSEHPRDRGCCCCFSFFPSQAPLPVGTCSTICIRAPCEHEGEEMLEAGFLQDYFFFS